MDKNKNKNYETKSNLCVRSPERKSLIGMLLFELSHKDIDYFIFLHTKQKKWAKDLRNQSSKTLSKVFIVVNLDICILRKLICTYESLYKF